MPYSFPKILEIVERPSNLLNISPLLRDSLTRFSMIPIPCLLLTYHSKADSKRSWANSATNMACCDSRMDSFNPFHHFGPSMAASSHHTRDWWMDGCDAVRSPDWRTTGSRLPWVQWTEQWERELVDLWINKIPMHPHRWLASVTWHGYTASWAFASSWPHFSPLSTSILRVEITGLVISPVCLLHSTLIGRCEGGSYSSFHKR